MDGATRDPDIANALLGTKIVKYVQDGIVAGYVSNSFCLQDLGGIFIHEITYLDPLVIGKDDMTYDVVLEANKLYHEIHNLEYKPINFNSTTRSNPTYHLSPIPISTPFLPNLPLNIPIPQSLNNYPITVSHLGSLRKGLITARAISDVGIPLWRLTLTSPEELIWIDNEQLHASIQFAKKIGHQKPPQSIFHSMTAVTDFIPQSTQGWPFVDNSFIGKMALIHINQYTNNSNNNKKKKIMHAVIVEAAACSNANSSSILCSSCD